MRLHRSASCPNLSLKMKFNFMIALTLLVAGCRPSPPATAPAAVDGGDVQRLVALFDYIAGDYGGAVEGGRVVNADELAEQQRFVHDARQIAAALLETRVAAAERAGDPLPRSVEAIADLVGRHAEPTEVAAACRAAKAAVVERFGLRTAPAGRPQLEPARALYAQSCAICHGPRGDAQTERGRELHPAPANFLDPETRQKLSPYRVYNTLTFGVSGTSMASFESLTAEERWSLAFYVLSLAHAGEAASESAAMPFNDAASMSDEEILAALRREGRPAPERDLAFLRTVLPFQEPQVAAGVTETRARVRQATAAYFAGEARQADRLLLDAYLQGFEPMEARLRARDPQGTAGLEQEFHALRASIGRGEPRDSVRTAALRLERRLSALAEPQRTVFPFAAALLIYLREGVEAALLVGGLLAAVRRFGHAEAARYVHGGWVAALPAGVVTWWVLDRLVALGPAQRELIEAGTALLAALVLFTVSFWMISKAESRRWMEYLKRTVTASLSRRNRLVLVSMSFLAVYREAAETVLFTEALLLDAADQRGQVWAGAAAGLAATLLLALFMRRAVLSLPIGPFFGVSGILLCLLSVSFAGSGLFALVAAGYMPARPVRFPEIAWLGVHPDLNGLLIQGTILLTIAVTGVYSFRRTSASPIPRNSEPA
jgi:high-affinity iron transporter